MIGLIGAACPYDEDELLDNAGATRWRWRILPQTRQRLEQMAAARGESMNKTLVELIVADVMGLSSFADTGLMRWCQKSLFRGASVQIGLYCGPALMETLHLRRHGLGVSMSVYLDGLITRAAEEPEEVFANLAEILGEAYTPL